MFLWYPHIQRQAILIKYLLVQIYLQILEEELVKFFNIARTNRTITLATIYQASGPIVQYPSNPELKYLSTIVQHSNSQYTVSSQFV